jgi:medium-chain acyl-[acyl-carrier-protein] hydrolase
MPPPQSLPIYNLPYAEFWQEIRNFNGTSDDVIENEDIVKLFLPILQADFTVLDTYSYSHQRTFDCPISVFGGLQDPTFSDYELEAWQEHKNAAFTRPLAELISCYNGVMSLF